MNLDKEMLPKHLAIIMDGNGRWAKQQGKPRIFGHEKGAKTVREIIQEVSEIGIPYLTLYAFSTENWKRPKLEVEALMHLLSRYLKKEVAIMQENNIRLNAQQLAQRVQQGLLIPQQITPELIQQTLYTQNIPPVDLLIRTSGECRISNFLLWQIAYAELYFTDILWPDFSPEELRKALANYQNRERRFGKTSEQL